MTSVGKGGWQSAQQKVSHQHIFFLSRALAREHEGQRVAPWPHVRVHTHWRVQDFCKGGSNISWFPKKRSSDFKRGGVQRSDRGGGPVH